MFFGKKEKETPSIQKSNKQGILVISVMAVFLLLLAVVIGTAVYYYNQYQAVLKKSALENKSELQSIIDTIGRFMELPEDEEPTLATVTDTEKIKDQPFFTKAQNGDKVLFYTKAAQAILYRPSTGKIINMTTVNVTDEKAAEDPLQETAVMSSIETPATTVAPSVAFQATIALYNGSTKVGVTNILDDEIKAAFPDVTVGAKEKAVRSDYTETQVIDLSGKNADFVTKLAEAISGKVVAILPAGEVNPGTDILVIVGQK